MWSNVVIDGEVPPERCKHAVALSPNELYLYGGRAGTWYLKDFWKLELRAGKWSKLVSENSPPSLHEHSLIYHKELLYLFGGEIGLDDSTSLWIYNTKKQDWRKWVGESKAKAPNCCRGHVSVVYSGHMLVHGGYKELKGSLGDIWAFHFETESWHLFYKHSPPSWFSLHSVPVPRHSHGGAIHCGTLYIYGGMNDLEECGDFWKFDLTCRRWSQLKLKPNPGPIISPTLAIALGSLFLYGGIRNGKPINELWKFSFVNESWEKLSLHGLKPSGRYFPSITMLPAIIKVKNKIGDESKDKLSYSKSEENDDNKTYWWDFNISNLKKIKVPLPPPPKVSILRKISGDYEALGTQVDEFIDSPDEIEPKRSESTICFRSANPSYQRVQKSNSVRFSDFKQLSNSTSDYSSMENLEDSKNRAGFENPNYTTDFTNGIELRTFSHGGTGEGPPEIEVTTPNYLLMIGGFETENGHVEMKPLTIWRLRVGQELIM